MKDRRPQVQALKPDDLSALIYGYVKRFALRKRFKIVCLLIDGPNLVDRSVYALGGDGLENVHYSGGVEW